MVTIGPKVPKPFMNSFMSNHSMSNLHNRNTQNLGNHISINSVRRWPIGQGKSKVTVNSSYVNKIKKSKILSNKFTNTKGKESLTRLDAKYDDIKSRYSKYFQKDTSIKQPAKMMNQKLVRCQSFVQKPNIKNTKVRFRI
jgi:hypothetical protein